MLIIFIVLVPVCCTGFNVLDSCPKKETTSLMLIILGLRYCANCIILIKELFKASKTSASTTLTEPSGLTVESIFVKKGTNCEALFILESNC